MSLCLCLVVISLAFFKSLIALLTVAGDSFMSPLLFLRRAGTRRFYRTGRRGRYRPQRLGVASPFYRERLIYSLISSWGGLSVLMTTFLCLSAFCSTLEFSGPSLCSAISCVWILWQRTLYQTQYHP